MPYDYSAYPTLFDDLSGYAPAIVGMSLGPDGREVILIALSPGKVISSTLVGQGKVPGQDPSGSSALVLAALSAVRRDAKPGTEGNHAGPSYRTSDRETA